jgi:predicted transcriptional regulator
VSICPGCGRPVPESLAAEIREGMAEAERGETVDLGSFAQYGTEGEAAGSA